MKFENFDEFYQKSQDLFLANPDRSRYSIKYQPGLQKLVIKTTDDFKTYTFHTESHPEAKRIDELTSAMMKLMAAPHLDATSVKLLLAKTEEETATIMDNVNTIEQNKQNKLHPENFNKKKAKRV